VEEAFSICQNFGHCGTIKWKNGRRPHEYYCRERTVAQMKNLFMSNSCWRHAKRRGAPDYCDVDHTMSKAMTIPRRGACSNRMPTPPILVAARTAHRRNTLWPGRHTAIEIHSVAAYH
jgi:hypothetical protein